MVEGDLIDAAGFRGEVVRCCQVWSPMEIDLFELLHEQRTPAWRKLAARANQPPPQPGGPGVGATPSQPQLPLTSHRGLVAVSSVFLPR
jgi:hypothetical protein